ncbi:MAG TPA: hypothetical protein VMV92_11505 [Streptosporangiaceae bacterium]|nr:hypothetical protein [Streptosporangiaceae bacterium]
MTAVIAPVIPSSARLPARGPGRAGTPRRLPVAAVTVIPSAPEDVVYGLGRIDASGASRQAVVEAALVLLERMGLSPADLAAVPKARPELPTFAEYVPVVSVAVTAGTRPSLAAPREWHNRETSFRMA